MAERCDIVRASRAWIGTPYKHQGRTIGKAVDCIGLVIGVAKEIGAVPEDFDFNGYSRVPSGDNLLYQLESRLPRVERHDVGIGDIILVAISSDPQHVGIIGDYRLGGHSLIHACATCAPTPRVVEHRLMYSQNLKFVAAFSLLK